MTTFTPKEYAAHLAEAGLRLHPLATRTVNKAAMNVRDEWRRLAREKNPAGSASARYPGTIVLRRGRFDGPDYSITVETLDRGQGPLGSILEHGGAHNAPQRSNVAALAKEAPVLAEWLAKIARDVI